MKDLLSLTIPGPSGTSVGITPPTGIPSGLSLGKITTSFLQVAMVIGVILSLFYLIYGGFYWLQSKGDKEKLDKARRIITSSMLGLIIMSLSLVIVSFISQALGIDTLIGAP